MSIKLFSNKAPILCCSEFWLKRVFYYIMYISVWILCTMEYSRLLFIFKALSSNIKSFISELYEIQQMVWG